MDKLKGMLKISERDKKLLVVVLAVLIMALAYFFGFQNLSDQVDTLSTKIYTEVKKGIKPEMYALSTLIFVTVLVLLILVNKPPVKKGGEIV